MDGTELNWNIYFPGFTLVEETTVILHVEHSGKSILVPVGDIEIKPYDVIGIQHNSSLQQSPVQSRTNAQSKWRTSIIKAHENNWIHRLSRSTFPRRANWQENIVYKIEAITSFVETVKAPINLVKSYALETGEYTFTANVFNSVSNKIVSSSVVMLYKVHGFDLILPNIAPNKPISTLNNKLAVEANATSDFLWKISEGTQVAATWNLTTDNYTFTDECPGRLKSLSECQRQGWQFIYTTHSFPFIGEEKVVSVLFNALNPISSAAFIYDIVAQIPVSNLTLISPEPMMFRANNSVSLLAKIDSGSHVTYTWELDNNELTTDTGRTSYTFPAGGYYDVHVAASNGLGSLNSWGTVTLIAEANLGNLQIQVPSVVTAGNSATILASVEINRYSVVSFNFDLGDGSSLQREGRVESLRTTTVANEAVQKSYSLPENEDFKEVSISVVVVDNLYWNKTVTPALRNMKGEYGTTWTNKTIQVVKGIQIAEILLVNPATAYPSETSVEFSAAQTGGTGSMYYSWNFDDDSEVEITNNGSIHHTFGSAGVYTVSVEITNNASCAVASVAVYIEEPIGNLKLSYDGPTPLGQITILTAGITAGSAVMYQFYPGDDSTPLSTQSASSFRHQYSSVDKFNAVVVASNNVSKLSASIWVYTMDNTTLVFIDIKSNACVATDEEIVFKAVVVHLNPSNLNYRWHFGDDSELAGVGLTEVRHAFPQSGNYVVNAIALEYVPLDQIIRNSGEEFDPLNSKPLPLRDIYQTSVCVEDRIGGIEVITSSPLAIRGGTPVEVELEVRFIIRAGSDYTVTWKYRGTSQSNRGRWVPTIAYTSAGMYSVKLIVANKVSREVVVTEVDVQEIIEVPTISYNASSRYLSTKEHYKFAPNIAYGTSITYIWNTYSTQNTSNMQTFDTESIIVQMSEVDTYIIKLAANNDVSNASVSTELYLQDPVSNLQVSANSTTVLVGGTIGFVSQIDEGSSVTYNWTLCEENTCQVMLPETTAAEFIHTFPNMGLYYVEVKASNEISFEIIEIAVTVIGAVQNASIRVTNPVLMEDRYVSRGSEITLVGTVEQGNEVAYSWRIETPSGELALRGGHAITFVLEEAGLYTFGLNVSNPVSQEIVKYEIESIQPINELNLISINGTRGKLGDKMKYEVDLGSPVAPETVYSWSITKVGSNLTAIFEETEGKIVHLFSEYGTYNVSVQVFNVVSMGRDNVIVTIAENVGMVEISVEGHSSHYVRTGQTIMFRGLLDQGTLTSFEWLFTDSIPPKVYTTQDVSYVFNTVGAFKVKLNVSNSVSFTNVGLTIYSEEVIANLTIGVNGTGPSGRLTPLSDPLVFVAHVDKGSNLTYAWDFGEGDGLIENSNRTILHKFSSAGVFTVKAIVENDLSRAEQRIQITVQEKIKGLEVVNCCDQVVSTETLFWFEAKISAGSDVSYKWAIRRPNGIIFERNATKFSYILHYSGIYSIQLNAANKVGTATVSGDLLVEEEIRDVRIEGENQIYDGHRGLYYANTEGGTNLKYKWKVNFSLQPDAVNKTFIYFFTIDDIMWKFVWLTVEAYNDVSHETDSKIVVVELLKCDNLEVIPIGEEDRTELRSRTIHMENRISSNCSGTSRYPVIYSWEMYKSNCKDIRDDTEVAHLLEVDKRTPSLVIPANHGDMQYGSYCAKFTAAYDLDPKVETIIKIDLEITKSPLVAMIKGGEERCFSVNQEILLDGSSSYDPDNQFSELGYNWTCYEMVTVNSYCLLNSTAVVRNVLVANNVSRSNREILQWFLAICHWEACRLILSMYLCFTCINKT